MPQNEASTGGVGGESELCRLIYFSCSGPNLNRAALKDILKKSARNNLEIRVTGALYLDQRYFFQILEGKRWAVNRLFRKISADPRHNSIGLISFEVVSERLFPAWSMLLLGCDASTRALYQQYCAATTFQPQNMTAAGALAFIQELAGRLQISGAPESPSTSSDHPASSTRFPFAEADGNC